MEEGWEAYNLQKGPRRTCLRAVRRTTDCYYNAPPPHKQDNGGNIICPQAVILQREEIHWEGMEKKNSPKLISQPSPFFPHTAKKLPFPLQQSLQNWGNFFFSFFNFGCMRERERGDFFLVKTEGLLCPQQFPLQSFNFYFRANENRKRWPEGLIQDEIKASSSLVPGEKRRKEKHFIFEKQRALSLLSPYTCLKA